MGARDAYVLDATPIFAGYSPSITSAPHFTTNEILRELGETERLRLSVSGGWLQIREPSKQSLLWVRKAASESGDRLVLSSADISILAVSLELMGEGFRVRLVTDDYAVQNVASKLRIGIQNYLWKGIRREIKWELYCPTCRKTYNTQRQTCPSCGSTLKRRPSRRKVRTVNVKS